MAGPRTAQAIGEEWAAEGGEREREIEGRRSGRKGERGRARGRTTRAVRASERA